MAFSAQYQQAPEPAGGKIIKRKMLQYYSEIERLPTDRIVMSWDVALSEQETAITLLASFCSTAAIVTMCLRWCAGSSHSTN